MTPGSGFLRVNISSVSQYAQIDARTVGLFERRHGDIIDIADTI
jgi:hypothetical protein